MFAAFSSVNRASVTEADAKIDGVKGRIYKFSEDIINRIYAPEESEEQNDFKSTKVLLGGYPVGLKLYADGVVVVDTERVDTENGDVDTAGNAGLQIGDVIKEINGIRVTTNKEVSQIMEQSNGVPLKLTVLRGKDVVYLDFTTAYSVSEGKYKAGIWIRDSSAGIGTVTFSMRDGYFAALGHAVCDIDTKQVIPISQGETTDVSIVEYVKGKSGCAGELCGYLESDKTGEVLFNGDLGVYGKFQAPRQTTVYEIASAKEIKVGEASIFTTIENGVIREYSISITSINEDAEDNKHLTIKITDDKLINETGGIIQGMSGSPIVQNGKLVGAVTHVFLNDPTGGYGILAQTMLEKVNDISLN